MKLKVAVIGVGSMGRNHARVYWEMQDVDLVAVVDTDQAKANIVAKHFSTNAYTDYKKMLDQEQPDAVSIAVPTIYHMEVALEVIRHGISLLIEKPIASNLQNGQKIISAAKQAGVKLMVGHIERFNPAVIALKEHLIKGELGQLYEIDARRQGPFPTRINDVGVVIDLAVHDLDIMRYITQAEVTRLYAETVQGLHSKQDDLLTGIVRLSSGVVGSFIINWITPTKICEFYAIGQFGMFKIDYLTQDLYFYENSLVNGSDWESLRVLRGV